MITSSLPPELKVMIAGAFLLAGVLLALYFPADHAEESPSSALAAVAENNSPESSSTTPVTLASTGSSGGEGSRFEGIDDFVRRDLSASETSASRTPPSSWSRTSMPEPAVDTENHTAATSPEPSPEPPTGSSYGGIPIPERSTEPSAEDRIMQYTPLQAEIETPPKPPYQPFQATPMNIPEPNPAFFAEPSLPSNLTSLAQIPAESQSVVSPSSANVARPVTAFAAVPVAPIATPVAPVASAAVPVSTGASTQPAIAVRAAEPVVASRRSEGTVIYAPARTVIVPDR